MATPSLNFRNRAENGKTRFAQTVPVLFSARLRKFKAPSRAGTAKPAGHRPGRCLPPSVEAQNPGIGVRNVNVGVPNLTAEARNLNVGVRVLHSRRSEPQSRRSEPRCRSLRTAKLRFRTPKSAFRTPTSEFRTPKLKFGTPKSEFRTSKLKFRTSKSKFRTSRSKSQPSKARVQHLEVRVPNFEVDPQIPKSQHEHGARTGVLTHQRQYHDGVAVPCPRWRLEFLLQRGKRKGNCLSEASFSLPLSAT